MLQGAKHYEQHTKPQINSAGKQTEDWVYTKLRIDSQMSCTKSIAWLQAAQCKEVNTHAKPRIYSGSKEILNPGSTHQNKLFCVKKVRKRLNPWSTQLENKYLTPGPLS